ncbi:hypothetical protein PCI56_00835 [Plesiomonas shigelloides subsp. oncorhynchi]|nr:hypothetical protein [Plesiomonas shigelloides]
MQAPRPWGCKTWGAAAAGSLMGDVMLFKMLTGKGAKGIVASATKGAAGEGIGEMLEEGTQQYAVNQAVSETTGIESDPWKGVASSAIEGGLIGAGTVARWVLLAALAPL